MPTGDSIVTWGEPEQAPHIHDVQEFCLCLSVRTFIIQQFTNVVLIYGVSLIDDCSFKTHILYCFCINKVVMTNKLNKQFINWEANLLIILRKPFCLLLLEFINHYTCYPTLHNVLPYMWNFMVYNSYYL